MEIKYNKKSKIYFNVMCSVCKNIREIYRIGGDNTKKFYCTHCHKMQEPMLIRDLTLLNKYK